MSDDTDTHIALPVSRTLALRTWGPEQLTNSDKTKASTLAGASAGMVGGLIRKNMQSIPFHSHAASSS